MQSSSTSAHAALWQLIKDIKFGMFTTRHTDGSMHSRPMTTQNRSVDEDNTLWFFMSRSGEPVAALALVKVTIVRAHYWDVKFSKIVQLYDIAKAAITDVQRQRKKLPARLLPLVPPAALQ